jgi:hypothetical protein
MVSDGAGDWIKVGGKQHRQCGKKGCTGHVPKYVLAASQRDGGPGVFCRLCNSQYRKLPPSPKGNGKGGGGGRRNGGDKEEEWQQLRRQVAALKKEIAESKTNGTEQKDDLSSQGAAPVQSASPAREAQEAFDAAQAKVDFLNNFSPNQRQCVSSFDSDLATAVAKRDELLAAKKAAMPLRVQLDQAQKRADKSAKQVEKDEKAAETLEKQKEALLAKIAEQSQAVQASRRANEEHMAAVQEIKRRFAEEGTGATTTGTTPVATTEVQAALSFFNAMAMRAPPEQRELAQSP